jgi:phthiocerol/phenolphthiocerol synthesis type-I polyketide synthase E
MTVDVDAIAVVGMSCRFPKAPSVAAFWQNLLDGVDAVHDYTEAELVACGIEPELRRDPAHVKAGGRLTGIADFDAEFFGFTPDEAATTDPQHRLFIETAWEALEDAGCDPERYQGTIGVFAGSSISRYFLFHLFGRQTAMRADWEGRITPFQSPDYLPAQVAYRLGLTGPAVAVQTACSSSLVSVCLAAQSLADYRCDLALAGGVSVIWPRHRYAPGGLVSPDGRCHAFDAAARGSGFGSGSGTVALKRLDDAERERDHVYAVLPGWAVTNDGSGRAGFAAPGVSGQAAAVTEALAAADIGSDEVGLVEAHASGTPLGDAIEVAALNRAFRATGRTKREQCALGAVKSSISNLDAAAGIAGLIKAVLACSAGVVPANLHFTDPHPDIEIAGSPFFVPVKAVPWDEPDRIAGVSSVGLGGTNAHVLVAPPPDQSHQPDQPDRPNTTGPWTLRLSARTPTDLRAVAGRLRGWLDEHPGVRLADVAYTLAEGRRRFDRTASVSARTVGAAIAALARVESGAAIDDPVADLGVGGRTISLPTYPFARRRHWIEPLP